MTSTAPAAIAPEKVSSEIKASPAPDPYEFEDPEDRIARRRKEYNDKKLKREFDAFVKQKEDEKQKRKEEFQARKAAKAAPPGAPPATPGAPPALPTAPVPVEEKPKKKRTPKPKVKPVVPDSDSSSSDDEAPPPKQKEQARKKEAPKREKKEETPAPRFEDTMAYKLIFGRRS